MSENKQKKMPPEFGSRVPDTSTVDKEVDADAD